MSMNGNGVSGALDLSEAIPLDTIEHEVLLPDGTPSGWVITICDLAHPKAQARMDETRRRTLREQKRAAQAAASNKKFVPEERTVDEERLDNARWLVSRVIGWEPAIKLSYVSDSPLAFSDDAAMRVFMHPKSYWFVGPLLEVITNDQAFTKRSPKTSEPSPSANSYSPQENPTEQPTENS